MCQHAQHNNLPNAPTQLFQAFHSLLLTGAFQHVLRRLTPLSTEQTVSFISHKQSWRFTQLLRRLVPFKYWWKKQAALSVTNTAVCSAFKKAGSFKYGINSQLYQSLIKLSTQILRGLAHLSTKQIPYQSLIMLTVCSAFEKAGSFKYWAKQQPQKVNFIMSLIQLTVLSAFEKADTWAKKTTVLSVTSQANCSLRKIVLTSTF